MSVVIHSDCCCFPPVLPVCSLLTSGVAAIFGPQSGQTSAHVQSICDALEVPHIENRWDFRLTPDAYSINLYPHHSTLAQVGVSFSTDVTACKIHNLHLLSIYQ